MNPLVLRPLTAPVLERAAALRRQVVGKLRSFDLIRWPNVAYGEDIAQRMIIHQKDDLAPRDGWPAVLLLHGGGWQQGSAEDFAALAPLLCRKGLLVASVSYRLAPAHRWPAALEDAEAALDFLRHQQVDLDRIAIWGHSAGGQLALLTGLLHREQVRCVVALGAPTDVGAASDREALLERVFTEEDLEGASALRRPERPPPTLLVHGEHDPVVPVATARAYAARFPEEVRLIEVPEGDHGLRWPPLRAAAARSEAIDWMMEQLAPNPRGSKWRIRRPPKKGA
jgi:acetyl esterase/lipase